MLSLALRAIHENEIQTLFIDRLDDGEVTFCLVGTYQGRPIQIDFEGMGPEDVDDLILLLEHRRGLWCRQCRQPHEPCGEEDPDGEQHGN